MWCVCGGSSVLGVGAAAVIRHTHTLEPQTRLPCSCSWPLSAGQAPNLNAPYLGPDTSRDGQTNRPSSSINKATVIRAKLASMPMHKPTNMVGFLADAASIMPCAVYRVQSAERTEHSSVSQKRTTVIRMNNWLINMKHQCCAVCYP